MRPKREKRGENVMSTDEFPSSRMCQILLQTQFLPHLKLPSAEQRRRTTYTTGKTKSSFFNVFFRCCTFVRIKKSKR